MERCLIHNRELTKEAPKGFVSPCSTMTDTVYRVPEDNDHHAYGFCLECGHSYVTQHLKEDPEAPPIKWPWERAATVEAKWLWRGQGTGERRDPHLKAKRVLADALVTVAKERAQRHYNGNADINAALEDVLTHLSMVAENLTR